jgi:hypothetical protein
MATIIDENVLLEHAGTIHRDFSHSLYDPGPAAGVRYHSGTLLNILLRSAGLHAFLPDILARLRAHLGEDETIWGVKFIAGKPCAVELYVSNREEPSPLTLRTFEALRDVLYPWLDGFRTPPACCPYTMVSFEFDVPSAAQRRVANANFYVSSHVRAIAKDGYSYELCSDSILMRNHYRHFTLPEVDDLRNRIRFSPRIVSPEDVDVLLPRDLHGCRSVSYAAKPSADGLYFRRIPFDRAVKFADSYGLGEVGSVLAAHRAELGHLTWDVGYDFSAPASETASLSLGKAAIYGLW